MAKEKITDADRERSAKARRARESGRALSNYATEVAREMTRMKKRTPSTPSKKA